MKILKNGKTRLLILACFILVTLLSCKKDKEFTPNLGGYFQVEIESSRELEGISMDYSELTPIENTDAEIDFEWDKIETNNSTKVYKSNRILTGTYYFYYRLEIQSGQYSTDYDYSNYRNHVIQIFPGETTIVKGVF